MAYRDDLLDAFVAGTGQSIYDLKKSEAHIVEADVALARERGVMSISLTDPAYFKCCCRVLRGDVPFG